MPDLAELNIKVNSLEAKVAEQALNRLNQTAGQSEGIASKLASGYGKLAGIMSLLASAASLLGSSLIAIKTAARFETIELGFTTLLKSADKAKAMIASLEDFSKTTPFEFEGLAKTSKLMLAMGFEAKDLSGILRTVGDATAAMGGGNDMLDRMVLALGQINAKGKLSAQEMNQLAEAGIPAWRYLSETIGKSIPEAMQKAENGAISSKVAITAILAGMQKDYAGGMKALSLTTEGLWSNLKDSLNFTLRDIGKVLIETLDIRGLIQRVTDAMDHYGKIFIDIIRIFAGMKPQFAETAAEAEKVAKQIKAIGEAALFLAGTIATIKLTTMAVQGLSAAWKAVSVAMASNPIGLALVAIAAAIAGLIYAYEAWGDAQVKVLGIGISLRDVFKSYLEVIKTDVNVIVLLFTKLYQAFSKAFESSAIKSSFTSFLSSIRSSWEGLWTIIASAFGGTFGGIMDSMVSMWNDTMGKIMNGGFTFGDIIGGAADYINEAVPRILDLMSGFIDDFAKGVMSVFDFLFKNSLLSYFLTFSASWTKMLVEALGSLKTFVNMVIGLFTGMVEAIKLTFSSIANALKAFGDIDFRNPHSFITAAAKMEIALDPKAYYKNLAAVWKESLSRDFIGEVVGNFGDQLTGAFAGMKNAYQKEWDRFMGFIQSRKDARQDNGIAARALKDALAFGMESDKPSDPFANDKPRDTGPELLTVNIEKKIKAMEQETNAMRLNNIQREVSNALFKEEEAGLVQGTELYDRYAIALNKFETAKVSEELVKQNRELNLQISLVGQSSNAHAIAAEKLKMENEGLHEGNFLYEYRIELMQRLQTAEQEHELKTKIEDMKQEVALLGKSNGEVQAAIEAKRMEREGYVMTSQAVQDYLQAIKDTDEAKRRFGLDREIEDMNQEIHMIGRSNNEKEKASALLRLTREGWAENSEEVKRYMAALEQLQEAKKLDALAHEIGDAFADTFTDVLMGTKKLSDAFRELAKEIEKMLIKAFVTKPLGDAISGIAGSVLGGLGGLGGGGGAGGGLGSLFGGLFAKGGVFNHGALYPMATGGIVDSPTFFPYGGGTGVMGEAGPEAVMPLTRDSSGRLGVRGGGGGGTIVQNFNISTPDASSFRRSQRQILQDARRGLK